jgi:hypothetical protein
MAIVRDNRGALLASNLSKYLAGAANTAGTPIDTNEMVNIINQFLSTGEQISSDATSISNGIYKKFGANDKVTNRTQVVTSGIWSGDTGSLGSTMATSSIEVASYPTSKTSPYYINVYNKPTSSSDAEVQFSIAYGDINGYGSPSLAVDDGSLLASKSTYAQYRNILLDPADTYFSVYSGSTAGGYNMQNFYAININRARYKERLDPGNISITLSGTSGNTTLIDDSNGTNESVTTAGRVYNIVSGSLNIGTSNAATIQSPTSSNGQGWGLFYPDMGIILLNPAALAAKVDIKLTAPTTTTAASTYYNSTAGSGSLRLFEVLKAGGDFQVRRTENVSTSHYFVRANNREFNFSNNPTFVTGSVGQFVQGLFENDPHVWITSVGLYDDSNELLAVAKLSSPIEKTFDKEVAIKVKLDF